MKFSWKSFFKEILFWLKIIGIGILLAIVLRVFFFAAFVIPTPSMEPAIIPCDKVIVYKMIPGPRIIRNFFSLHKGEKPDIKRLKGMRAVRRNDVLIFNYPYSDWNRLEMDMNVFYAKRCVAIPGDTFYIENGIYKVKNCPDTLGNYEAQYRFSQREEKDIPTEIYHCFPHDDAYRWNVKSFGPLYVPRQGDTIVIDSKNIALYRNLIRYETDKEINLYNDTVYLGRKHLQSYIFQQNYYFMAGDLTFDSRDSRYWGLLPEDHIVGKAAIIWKSEDKQTGKRRWERFLKKIQ
ncbi:MAG: signal peptidase I [Prevotellaceae bacterium]|jgi:signal peptidase I|nr:signal peptidase I [Prevotellaceae bacterium]